MHLLCSRVILCAVLVSLITVSIADPVLVTVKGSSERFTREFQTMAVQRRHKRGAPATPAVGHGIGSTIPLRLPSIRSGLKERVVGVGTGSMSLDMRRPTIRVDGSDAKASSRVVLSEYFDLIRFCSMFNVSSSISDFISRFSGTRSDVNWSGKTQQINDKSIAVGPGTFVFGTGPTGAFMKKAD
ncbi:unnamed protein product [Anisakis simplex]|uniref:Dirigent protein n=1 Tax=Anisakis simplex TaxID=6269 RepID=A0A0M3J8B5_ANISI|nr:unnamed protein product [Anisakis simplex]